MLPCYQRPNLTMTLNFAACADTDRRIPACRSSLLHHSQTPRMLRDSRPQLRQASLKARPSRSEITQLESGVTTHPAPLCPYALYPQKIGCPSGESVTPPVGRRFLSPIWARL